MAENFPRLYRAANAKRPDLWIYCEMQWDNLLDPVANEAQKKLPRGGIYQHEQDLRRLSGCPPEVETSLLQHQPAFGLVPSDLHRFMYTVRVHDSRLSDQVSCRLSLPPIQRLRSAADPS